jgi:hypothetical protein
MAFSMSFAFPLAALVKVLPSMGEVFAAIGFYPLAINVMIVFFFESRAGCHIGFGSRRRGGSTHGEAF